jgi:very-short-patch-repair endonuclease
VAQSAGRVLMRKQRERYLLNNARSLRKNMTKEERHLWYDFLRGFSLRFRRQEIIGGYIADFYCDKAKMIVELDGGQHYENDATKYDLKRTEYMNSLGITVLRYSNLDVMKNFEGVCTDIKNHIHPLVG